MLAAGGCTFGDIVDFTAFMVDPETASPVFAKVRQEFWGEPPYPTLTVIGVTYLASFRFELKVTAKLPEDIARG